MSPTAFVPHPKCKAKNPYTCRVHGAVAPLLYGPGGTPMRRHSNVDQFERSTRQILCLDSTRTKDYAEKLEALHNLPDDRKPVHFRGLTSSELKEVFNKIRSEMETVNGQPLELVTSDDNADNYDFTDVNTGKIFELKLGSMTNANSGTGLIDWALEDESQTISGILRESAKERVALYEKDHTNEEAIMASREETALTVAKIIAAAAPRGSQANDKLAHVARSISYSITRQKDISDSYERYVNYKANPESFGFTTKEQIEKYIYGTNLPTTILVKSNKEVETITYDNNPLEDYEIIKSGAAENNLNAFFIIRGKESKMSAKILQGYKNNGKTKDGRKIPAKFFVSSPAFYIWLQRPKVEAI